MGEFVLAEEFVGGGGTIVRRQWPGWGLGQLFGGICRGGEVVCELIVPGAFVLGQ